MEQKEIDTYQFLINTIKVLALPYEQQVKCFPHFVDVPFEVVDDFLKAMKFYFPELVENEKFSYLAIASILTLQNRVNFILEQKEYSDLEENQFANDRLWNFIRSDAEEILNLLNVPMGIPDQQQ